MKDNRKKTLKKLSKFYERIKKAKFFKVTDEFFKSEHMPHFIQNIKIDKHPSWCRDMKVDTAYDGNDFIQNKITVRIDYTYPKYGNC